MSNPLSAKECVICGSERHVDDMSNQAWPDGKYRWVCRNFAVCARALATARDMETQGRPHDDLDPRLGPDASVRHLRMRTERMAEIDTGKEE
jgi:hypothetical protein